VLQIIMPLAGAGQRFKDAGVDKAKPFIDVEGTPMCQMVWGNVEPWKRRDTLKAQYELTVITRSELESQMIDTLAPNNLIAVRKTTEGAACTVLLASDIIDNYDPVMIVNGDQYIEGFAIDQFLDYAKDYHGAILTFDVSMKDPPKWSYVRRGMAPSQVIAVAEKKAISAEATCGIYWFRHGRDLLRAIHAMMTKNLRVNGEFYLCPVFNEMISEGLKISAWNVTRHAGRMWGLGTPEDLETFLARSNPAERASENMEKVQFVPHDCVSGS